MLSKRCNEPSTHCITPSEFYQIEQNITELNNHPPKPGPNGYWLVYNVKSKEYEESDIKLGDIEDKEFQFSQTVVSDKWLVKHDLNKYPSVTIVDSGGNQVFGEVEYIDENNLKISFSSPFSGKAYLN